MTGEEMALGFNHRESGAEAPPADGGVPDLYLLLTEKSVEAVKITFWLGILFGLWFIMGAYQTNESVKSAGSIDDLISTWHDWVWIGAAGAGMFASFTVCLYLMDHRKPGDPPYDFLAAVGGAISAVIVIVMLFEYVEPLHSAVLPDSGFLWPGAKPLWFLPLSALGIALPMAALLLARKGSIRDSALGLFLSFAPVIVFSMPSMMNLDEADIIRWIPSLYFVGGLSLMLAGLRPFERLSRFTLDSVEYVIPRALAFGLVFVGIISWLMVSEDDTLSSSIDSVWILPLVMNVIMSVALLAAVNNAPFSDVGWARDRQSPGEHRALLVLLVASMVSALYSVLVVSLFALDYLGFHSLPRTVWLYPLSVAGMTLVMLGISQRGPATVVDRISGLLYASLPVVVTASFASAWAILSKPDVAYPLLAERMALLTYFGFALSVLVSGVKIETFLKAQWPVLREKSALNSKRYREVLRQVSRNFMGLVGVCILVVFVIIAVIGPYVAPYEVDMTINGQFSGLMPQSSEHWMGTDYFGHDVFSQLLYGAKTSITVGVVAAVISSFLGAAIGLYSGYVGGWRDEAIMRLNDIVLSIPWLVLMIIIAAMMGSIDLTGIILVIGLTGWSGTARLVRAQVLSLRERQYIERAKAIGSDDMHIIRTHILPNAFPLVFANTILTVAGSILAEATLSFLGLEPQGVVTWGTMLSDAQEQGAFTLGLHWWIVAPGLCIVIVVLGFTLLGYALDDVMNPKLRKR